MGHHTQPMAVTVARAPRWPLVAALPAKVQFVSSELDVFIFFAPMRLESLHHCGMSPRERIK